MYKTAHRYNINNPNDRVQLECLRRALNRKRFGCFFQQRIGKSRVGVDYAGYALARGVDRVLILCPPSAAMGWVRELQMLGDTGRTVCFQHWTAGSQRLRCTRPLVVLATYDLAVANARKLKGYEPQCIIFDEVHLLKNISARHKVARMLSDHAEWVLGLTGTPYSNREYLDVYGIFRVIDKSLFGTSKKAFIAKYADYVDEYGSPKTWMAQAEEEILGRVAEASMRVTREDVGLLLDTNEQVVRYSLGTTEQNWYTAMRDNSVVVERDVTCAARHTWSWKIRLSQICCGCLVDTEHTQHDIYKVHPPSRALALGKALQERNGAQVIVVIKYTEGLEQLVEYLEQSTGRQVYVIRGGLTLRQREDLIQHAKAQPESLLVVQERTVAMGMDLSYAKDMIFYSWSDDAILHSQVKDRIAGRFQDSDCVNYTYLVASNTADVQLLKHTLNHLSKAEALANWEKYRLKGRELDGTVEKYEYSCTGTSVYPSWN